MAARCCRVGPRRGAIETINSRQIELQEQTYHCVVLVALPHRSLRFVIWMRGNIEDIGRSVAICSGVQAVLAVSVCT